MGNRGSGNQGNPRPKSKPVPKLTENTPIGLRLSRSTLVLNLAVGSVRMMAGFSFWWIVVQGYLFCVLGVCELWLEPLFSRRRWIRYLGLLAVLAFAAWFSLGFVFLKAPLNALVFMANGEYPSGSLVHGIKWSRGLTEVRLSLYNPTDSDYQNIDVLLRPNAPLSNISQVSTLPGVFFIGDPKSGEMDIGNFVIGGVEVQKQLSDGTIVRTPLNAGWTTQGCRVRCPVLPKHTSLEMSLAVGIAGDLPNKLPTSIRLSGSYVGMFRSRVLDKTLSFVGVGR